MKKLKRRKRVKGFSLIELIVVIAIIAILAALAIPQYRKAKLSAIVSAHNSDVQTLKSAALIADLEGLEPGDITAETTENLDGSEMPELSPEIQEVTGENQFTVTKESDGEIVVSPGLVDINEGGSVEAKN